MLILTLGRISVSFTVAFYILTIPVIHETLH
jgi:hypothetical protein